VPNPVAAASLPIPLVVTVGPCPNGERTVNCR
jgi:hypothetical protein